jgi:hypothetical protein
MDNGFPDYTPRCIGVGASGRATWRKHLAGRINAEGTTDATATIDRLSSWNRIPAAMHKTPLPVGVGYVANRSV